MFRASRVWQAEGRERSNVSAKQAAQSGEGFRIEFQHHGVSVATMLRFSIQGRQRVSRRDTRGIQPYTSAQHRSDDGILTTQTATRSNFHRRLFLLRSGAQK